MEQWKNKIALVTGASSGIGKAVVEELVRRGMTVIAMARRIDKIKMYTEELKHLPGKVYPLQCDLTKREQVMQSMEWIEKNMSGVDVLINNAGVDLRTDFMTGTMDDWERTFDVNVLGLVAVTKHFLAMKKKMGTMDCGYIVNMNDFRCFTRHMTRERRMCAAYMASKWALRGITDTLRMELQILDSKIKVTNISPALVDTEMTTMETGKLRGRMTLEPRDVADAVINVMATRDTVLIRDMIVAPMLEIY